MADIQTLSKYQIVQLKYIYFNYIIENVGIVKETGVLVVEYIDNGVMVAKKFNRKS